MSEQKKFFFFGLVKKIWQAAINEDNYEYLLDSIAINFNNNFVKTNKKCNRLFETVQIVCDIYFREKFQ